ncbi:MSMEG_0567/Sll0786 family nitrogen starvation N-acetyltransferase [Methylobrevis pamukkalensis]|uniref:Acetyltransferase (GNAT) family protein n=1 Tax=Methylobrevis pamukkalensis TaxID=1439726 RepID=A0A1E3H3Z3_9HYPH|nr:MSMEG_0567/Sll0786 family nitrogen starvation N-acetyltransferase [Methylobrevis pamukkalensis]ODN71032.1 Acetyltransferase (GNAT) family protein [Methylobrevis pamukkalensis]
MIFDPFKPYIPSDYQVKFATEAWERREAAALRRAVFCEEQKIFEGDDRDAIDDVAIPIVAVSLMGVVAHQVVGTVRIHEAEPGVWWGSRLAVCRRHRSVGPLGAALIRLAVSSANARGCRRFLANVQVQNGLLFRRMRWDKTGEIEIEGRPHFRMEADLSHYPPIVDAATGFRQVPRKVAA